MNRVIANLLDNEVTHLPAGCHVNILLQASDQQAEILIEDDGPGFAPELRDRVFERFVKGKASTGHGLGLAFVDAVAKAHGGSVTVSGRAGGGALISLSIPMVEVLSEKVVS
jgi:signal transduction histidine kinase